MLEVGLESCHMQMIPSKADKSSQVSLRRVSRTGQVGEVMAAAVREGVS